MPDSPAEAAPATAPPAEAHPAAAAPAAPAPGSAPPAAASPAAAARPRRKRTWEAADDVAPAVSASDALAQARLIAARTSGMISVSAGVPPSVIAPPSSVGLPAPVPPPGMIGAPPAPAPATLTRELEINQSKNKAALTRKATHEQIYEATGATVSIRGRYKPPGDSSTDERPLHLLLQAPSADSLDRAEAQLRELMGPPVSAADAADAAAAAASAAAAGAAPAGGGGGGFAAKIAVELGADFGGGSVRGKVLGPRGSYIRHIEAEAGVRVQLVGGLEPMGGGPAEPLTIEIAAPTERQLALATDLAHSLVRSVKQRLAAGGGGAVRQAPPYAPPQSGLPQPPPPPPGVYAQPPPPPPSAHQPTPPAPYPPAHGAYPPPSAYAAPHSAFAPPSSYGAGPAGYGGGASGGCCYAAPPGYAGSAPPAPYAEGQGQAYQHPPSFQPYYPQ